MKLINTIFSAVYTDATLTMTINITVTSTITTSTPPPLFFSETSYNIHYTTINNLQLNSHRLSRRCMRHLQKHDDTEAVKLEIRGFKRDLRQPLILSLIILSIACLEAFQTRVRVINCDFSLSLLLLSR